MLQLPDLLLEMLANGRWPRNAQEERAQNLWPRVPPERVRRLMPGESDLYLLAPPFTTIRIRSEHEPWWLSADAAAHEIDVDLAIDIGDFGLGSEVPLLLDYRDRMDRPRVLRLCRSDEASGDANHWVEVAPDFASFVRALGL
jgi:hypothetical protein